MRSNIELQHWTNDMIWKLLSITSVHEHLYAIWNISTLFLHWVSYRWKIRTQDNRNPNSCSWIVVWLSPCFASKQASQTYGVYVFLYVFSWSEKIYKLWINFKFVYNKAKSVIYIYFFLWYVYCPRFFFLPFCWVFYVRQAIKTAARDLVLHGIVSQSNQPSIINNQFYDCCSNINCNINTHFSFDVLCSNQLKNSELLQTMV